MTFDQTKEILTLLQCEYPQSFSKMDARQMATKLKLWTSKFAEDDYQIVKAAVDALILSSREFAPTIGLIKQTMQDLTEPDALTEGEAWELVSKACRNGIHGSRTEFDKLPPEVQAAVGSPEMLKQWAMMDEREVESVVASNFMRSYKVLAKRAREQAALPSDVKEMLGGLTQKMMIGGESNE